MTSKYLCTVYIFLANKDNNNNHFTALCLGLLEWAGTRRNIHPLTLIVVINHPYLRSPSRECIKTLHFDIQTAKENSQMAAYKCQGASEFDTIPHGACASLPQKTSSLLWWTMPSVTWWRIMAMVTWGWYVLTQHKAHTGMTSTRQL